MPGFCLYRKSSSAFSLIVDDFGVKLTNIHDLNKPMLAINTEYQTTVVLTRSKFLVFNSQWDYANGTHTLSMTERIPNLLTKRQFKPKNHTID